MGFSSSAEAVSKAFETLIVMADDESSLEQHMPW